MKNNALMSDEDLTKVAFAAKAIGSVAEAIGGSDQDCLLVAAVAKAVVVCCPHAKSPAVRAAEVNRLSETVQVILRHYQEMQEEGKIVPLNPPPPDQGLPN